MLCGPVLHRSWIKDPSLTSTAMSTRSFAAVIAVLFVFLEPSLVVVKKEVRPGHTILLIDNSRSMGHRDGYQKSEALKATWEKLGVADVPGATRMELVKKLLSLHDGEVIANAERLSAGDAVRLHGVRDLAVSGTGELVLWDVPPTDVRLEDA